MRRPRLCAGPQRQVMPSQSWCGSQKVGLVSAVREPAGRSGPTLQFMSPPHDAHSRTCRLAEIEGLSTSTGLLRMHHERTARYAAALVVMAAQAQTVRWSDGRPRHAYAQLSLALQYIFSSRTLAYAHTGLMKTSAGDFARLGATAAASANARQSGIRVGIRHVF